MTRLTRSLAMLALAAFAAGCFESPERTVEKGGFTFDFKALSDARFRTGDVARGNLAEGLSDWKSGYCWIHDSKIAASDPRRKEVRKGVEWKTEDRELVITKTPALATICGDAKLTASVSGGYSRTVKLPDTTGGLYRLSFKYRMRHDTGHFGGLLFTSRLSADAPKGEKAPGLQVFPLPNLWSEDGIWARDIRVPPHCDRVELTMRIDGIGELRFSDFAFSKQHFETPVTVRFSPAENIDSTFAFSAGQCGVMCVQTRRNEEAVGKRRYPEYELSLPRGYTLVEAIMTATNQPMSVSAGADGSTVYRMKANSYGGGVPPNEFQGWTPLAMLVKAADDAAPGTATFVMLQEGKPISNVAKVNVFTIPAIHAVPPKRYCNGFYPGGPYCAFKTSAAREGFADLFTAAGATWVANMQADEDVYALWRRKGIRFITPEWYNCANGFRVGDGKGRPDDQKYVTPATDNPDYARATCPIAVYEEKSYFKEKFVPQLEKYLKGADGLWANWEPYYFAGRGCFCDNCCRAFADWMKVPFEEMKKDWPHSLKWGEKYGKDVLKFRSWQHGRLVKTINKYVIKATGGDRSLGFIPGIAWCEMASGWRPKNLAPEVQAIDYAGALRWIDPWGPYPWWSADAPYQESPKDMLGYWCAAKDVREQVNLDYAPGKRPKLMALPHGFQGNDAICQPEGVSLALDAFFFNGWESAIVYTFPKGFDARWWRAFADATSRAAKYEEPVLDGVRVDDKVLLVPDAGYPGPASGVHAKYLDWTKSVPYLQCAAYDHGGRRICAVFNFAHDAVAHFTLKAKDLPPGRYEVVSEDGAAWPKSRFSRTFTAAELAEGGVRLAVGALRTCVFELRPAR